MAWFRSFWWVFVQAKRSAPKATWLWLGCALCSAVIPPAMAYVGKVIVDVVVGALADGDAGWARDKRLIWTWVGVEGLLASALLIINRAQTICHEILSLKMGQKMVGQILQQASQLPLLDIEDHRNADVIQRTRREATARPIRLLSNSLNLLRLSVTLVASAFLLIGFSWWAVVIVMFAGLPPFLAEVRFSSALYSDRDKETKLQREQHNLESALSREDFAKELRFLGLAPELLSRFSRLGQALAQIKMRGLILRGLLATTLHIGSTALFYLAYTWIIRKTLHDRMSLGEMTMYLALFRQTQVGVTAVLTGAHQFFEDRLYVDEIQRFLDRPKQPSGSTTDSRAPTGDARVLEFNNVSFCYPDQPVAVLQDISFSLRHGQVAVLVGANGSGKSTLVKLILGLYSPGQGEIKLLGKSPELWGEATRRHTSALFQDFVKYKTTLLDNVTFGDVDHLGDTDDAQVASTAAGLGTLTQQLPNGWQTVLGKSFRGSYEPSLGWWQRVALARTWFNREAELVVLDEPNASLDDEAEARLVEQIGSLRKEGKAILVIAHRHPERFNPDLRLKLLGGRLDVETL